LVRPSPPAPVSLQAEGQAHPGLTRSTPSRFCLSAPHVHANAAFMSIGSTQPFASPGPRSDATPWSAPPSARSGGGARCSTTELSGTWQWRFQWRFQAEIYVASASSSGRCRAAATAAACDRERRRTLGQAHRKGKQGGAVR